MASTKRSKLIVGLDYGTTYSGIAFVHSTASDFRDIKAFTAWPGGPRESHEHLEKAPSVYAYASENSDSLDKDAWGYQVDAGMTSYSWTKLLLDEKALQSKDDDPGLKEAIASGLFRIPKDKKAIDVVSDYLRGIYTMFIATMEEKLNGADILAVTPIEFWLTVPAIWSDQAKTATKTAARQAGFASRPDDELYLIPEPEAAAHLALKSSLHRVDKLVEPNTGVLVCDCGGGTVDITSYTVVRTEPTLLLNESSVGRGGKCGATYIDRNLHDLLADRYGKPFYSLSPERIGPGSRFMNAFEAKKKDFSMTGSSRKVTKLQLKIPEFEASKHKVPHYDKDYAEILLSEADVKRCFDPVVERIIGLVSAQVEAVKEADQPPVNTIVLVGGLGASPYVRERLHQWAADREIRLTTPWSGAWSAVVCGAVLRGLEGSLIQKKMARRHYGHEIGIPYDPADPSKADGTPRKTFIDPYSGEKLVGGAVRWMVSKGDSFDEISEVSMLCNLTHLADTETETNMDLFSCALDQAPQWQDHPRVEKVGTVKVNFPDLDVEQFNSKKYMGFKLHLIEFDVRVKLGAKDGVLTFRVLSQGKEVGTANIDFSHT